MPWCAWACDRGLWWLGMRSCCTAGLPGSAACLLGWCRARADPRAGMGICLCVPLHTTQKACCLVSCVALPLQGASEMHVAVCCGLGPMAHGFLGPYACHCSLLCALASCCLRCLLPDGRLHSVSLATQPHLGRLQVGCQGLTFRTILVDMHCQDYIQC